MTRTLHRIISATTSGHRTYPALKRVIDWFTAVVILVLFSPLLLFIGIGIKLTSPGPVIFSQRRVGSGGTEFCILKFRTMAMACCAEEPQVDKSGRLFKKPGDPRVTPYGRWLRRFSLDELPQLLNVVRGEMSLVGPRPLPRSMLTGPAESLAERAAVRPGITGLWQIRDRAANTCLHPMLPHDLEYVRTISLRLDASIILRTLPAVWRGRGAV